MNNIFEKLTQRFVPVTKESARIYRSKIGKFQGWISVFVNSILFIIKFFIGLTINSISLMADAIHTLSDVVSSSVVIWGFHEAEKPADVEHPYGHGRIEYIATLIIAILLCVAGIEFIEASIRRIANPTPLTSEWWMVMILLGTIVIKEIIARYAEFLSAKIASGTLRADAWHHRSDAISSFLVVGAMIAGKFGYYAVDGWAGLGVAVFLIYIGYTIAKEAIDDLIGKPPTEEEVEEIRQIVTHLDGVLGAHDIVIHSYGKDKFVSMHVEINADETPERAHDIAEYVENVLTEKLGAEPTVHMDPVQPDNPKVHEVTHYLNENWIGDDRITDIHDIRIVETDKHKVILFGINIEQTMLKKQIVACCNELENAVEKEFQGYEVNIKVSPLYRF
ncbi:MAG: cation transporter [Candidatus Marinimicrobia bacterium]|nr:cation transporter [Candidatus Neomarinimicrobiota bacterium]